MSTPFSTMLFVLLTWTTAILDPNTVEEPQASVERVSSLVNPGFEDIPPLAGWTHPGWPLFQTGTACDARTGSKCAILEDKLGLTWGLFQQMVPVSAGKYNIQVWVRVEGGDAFLWVEGLDAKTKMLWSKKQHAPCSHQLNPLVPDFVPAEFMLGQDDWQPLQLQVDVPESVKYLNVKFGSYFMPGRIRFDDVSISRKTGE